MKYTSILSTAVYEPPPPINRKKLENFFLLEDFPLPSFWRLRKANQVRISTEIPDLCEKKSLRLSQIFENLTKKKLYMYF